MLNYLKVIGAFGVFVNAASDKIEAQPKKFRHNHQMLSRENVEIGAAIGAGAAGAIAGLGLGGMESSLSGGDDLIGGCLEGANFAALLDVWKSGTCQCELPGGAFDLDGFVNKSVSADVSLVIFTQPTNTADPNARSEVVWKYGNATCAPGLSEDSAPYFALTNVNPINGTFTCPFLTHAYVGQKLTDAEINEQKNGCSADISFLYFCAKYEGKRLEYAGTLTTDAITGNPACSSD